MFGDEGRREYERPKALTSGSKIQEGFERKEREYVFEDFRWQFAPDFGVHWRRSWSGRGVIHHQHVVVVPGGVLHRSLRDVLLCLV